MVVILNLFVIFLCINCILCLSDIYAKFVQNDYEVKEFRMESMGYNDKYLHYFNCVTYKYNRSTPAINASMKFKMDNLQDTFQTVIQGNKFASNEYRSFPIRFQTEFCGALDSDAMGIKQILSCGNIKECKFQKNKLYHICNLVYDGKKLPPLMPTGRYKIEVTIMYEDDFAFGYSIFGEVYRHVRMGK